MKLRLTRRTKRTQQESPAQERQEPPVIPKPVIQVAIEAAFDELLPHAIRNQFGRGIPLRWLKNGYANEPPCMFSLFAVLDPEIGSTVDITHPMPGHERNKKLDRVWMVNITEPAPPEDAEATFVTTSLGVSHGGDVVVGRDRYRKDETMRSDYFGRHVGGEQNSSLTPERRQELLDHVTGALTRLTAEIPDRQAAYLESAVARGIIL